MKQLLLTIVCTIAISLPNFAEEVLTVISTGEENATTGFVGINNKNPTEALDVDGNVEINGNVEVDGTITSESGNTYDPLPIGTILMFAGETWEDNVSLPGWIACTASNETRIIGQINVPNLEGHFLRGACTSINEEQGTTGGSDTVKIGLLIDNLPSHSHTIAPITADQLPHQHQQGGGAIEKKESRTYVPWGSYTAGPDKCNEISTNGNENQGEVIPFTSEEDPVITVTAPSTTGDEGSGEKFTVATVPVFYSVIYIIKVANGPYE